MTKAGSVDLVTLDLYIERYVPSRSILGSILGCGFDRLLPSFDRPGERTWERLMRPAWSLSCRGLPITT